MNIIEIMKEKEMKERNKYINKRIIKIWIKIMIYFKFKIWSINIIEENIIKWNKF